jgi:predicted alpha/beta hydrolase family esterase
MNMLGQLNLLTKKLLLNNMKKVFIVHGFEGEPNGGWRPWLMGKLALEDVWACALAMPNPGFPKKDEWVDEISRAVGLPNKDVFLVGHSLGVPAILRYLESLPSFSKIGGIILVSGPSQKNNNEKIDNFLEAPFNFPDLRLKFVKCVIIHGDDDPLVPLSNAEILAKELGGELIIISHGGHLNGSSGWRELPQALEAFNKMLKS